MSQTDIFSVLQTGLTQAGSVQTPGETHGTLTGMLCINNEVSPAAADVVAARCTAAGARAPPWRTRTPWR